MTETLRKLAALAQALEPHITLLYSPLEPDPSGKRSPQERQRAQQLISTHYQRTLSISHREDGAPYIEQMPQQSISISHCEDLLCIAIATEGYRLGIDIEQQSHQVPRVLPRVCSPMELSHLERYPEDETLKACLVWCAKEAVYKAISPAALTLKSLHLLQLRQESADSYSLSIAAKETQLYYRADALVLPRHILSLVCYQS